MTNLNINLNQGDTWQLDFTSQNLVGATIYSQMRTQDKKLLVATFSSAINSNTITLSLTNTQTSVIPKGLYLYDVRIKRGQDIKTEYRGSIAVL